mgnify:CR=1 FL=1
MTFTRAMFRWLLLASIGVAVIGGIADFVFSDWVPESVRAADAAALSDTSDVRAFIVGAFVVLCLIAAVAVTVGMYRFRAWARRWNLYLSAVSLVLIAALGYLVSNGFANALYELSAMLWGAVTFASYFSPVTAEFERPPVDS